MNQRFDTILKSGTVVNQDGEGVRDIGITDGRIAAIGGLAQASAARGRSTARACTSCPA